MSDEQDYESQLSAILAIEETQLKASAMPIGIYCQEAENLYYWAKEDSADLEGAGLESTWLEAIPVRVGALRIAEARWQKEFRAQKEAEKEWAEKSADAYELRDHLLRAFRYALRKEKASLKQVSAISDGANHEDMIQDLARLAALGKDHTEALNAIRLDLNLLDDAAKTADTMATLLAQVNGERLGGNDSKLIRDKAFMHLKEAVDEVRDCGKYVFYKQSTRLAGYSSAYLRRGNNKPKSTAANDTV